MFAPYFQINAAVWHCSPSSAFRAGIVAPRPRTCKRGRASGTTDRVPLPGCHWRLARQCSFRHAAAGTPPDATSPRLRSGFCLGPSLALRVRITSAPELTVTGQLRAGLSRRSGKRRRIDVCRAAPTDNISHKSVCPWGIIVCWTPMLERLSSALEWGVFGPVAGLESGSRSRTC